MSRKTEPLPQLSRAAVIIDTEISVISNRAGTKAGTLLVLTPIVTGYGYVDIPMSIFKCSAITPLSSLGKIASLLVLRH